MGLLDRAANKAKAKANEAKEKLMSSMDEMEGLDVGGVGDDASKGQEEFVAWLFPDARFKGTPTPLKVGDSTFQEWVCGNDAVSSVKVQSGYKVILFQHVDFKGKMREYVEDTANLGSFNDQASSAKVEKR